MKYSIRYFLFNEPAIAGLTRIYRADCTADTLAYRSATQPNRAARSACTLKIFLRGINDNNKQLLTNNGIGNFDTIEEITKERANEICREWYKEK